MYQKAMNEGHSAAWEQDWKRAAAEYRKALQEFPDQPKALNSLGLALYQTGEFAEAISIYQQAALLSPNDPVPLEKLAEISERVGDLKLAEESGMKAAEAYRKQGDVNKAVVNWSRVTTLNPEQAVALSRLAMNHERLGDNQRAVSEYLAVAGLLQRAGKVDKAQEIVTKTLQLIPDNPDAQEAQSLLKIGQALAKPQRKMGETEPDTITKAEQQQKPKEPTALAFDPVSETAQKALTKLAEILFDYSDYRRSAKLRGGDSPPGKDTVALSMQDAEQSAVVLHLGQAINAQSRKEDSTAADELELALEAGFHHAAAYFYIGYSRARCDRLESAIRNLAHAVKHNDYGLGSRLLLGEILFKKGLLKDAALEYLEALEIADSMTLPEEQSDDIKQLYEPLIEAQRGEKNEDTNRRLCENIRKLLMHENWREQILQSRQPDHKDQAKGIPTPLAEVMLQEQSSGVIGSIHRIQELARGGSLRSAMDEAFDAIQHSASYLPLHTLMGELLQKESRTPEAIAKFSVVAHAYGVRGEVNQAGRLLRRIIQLEPMDLTSRQKLIDQLIEGGKVDDAIKEYLDLAEIYIRQAELEMARKTYTTALHVVQETNANSSWSVQILQRMGDIDMQRLDWKQAYHDYEQIRILRPDDMAVRKQLVEVYTRLGQESLATAELENFLLYLESNGRTDECLPFVEELVREHEDRPFFGRVMAEQLHRQGRTEEAIRHLDTLGKSLLQGGKRKEAAEVVAQILAMNPPRADDYHKLLVQINKLHHP